MFEWNRTLFACFLVVVSVFVGDEGMATKGSGWGAMAAARTDPVELQAVYAMMAATGNSWASRIPDVCVKSGRWHGIECASDGEFFHVVGLSFGLVTDGATAFPSCAPGSTISPAVANLTHLRKLSYFACCAANPQPIPREIGALGVTLETLHLRSNGHVGAVPADLARLAKLAVLDLHGNALTGSMPGWLSSLRALQVVDLSDNAFGGQIAADTFRNLHRLVVLDSSANRLTGALPDTISSLSALKKLDLSCNNFTDGIPATLGSLGNLLALDLAHNALTGPIPSSLGALAKLRSMDLQGNRFHGPIPASFGNLRSLEGLVLSDAKLRGPIPGELGSLVNLRALFLDGNELTGAIPPALGGLARLYEMELSRNLLEGPVPFSASFVSRLGRRLRLEQNAGLCPEVQGGRNSSLALQSSTTWPSRFALCHGSHMSHDPSIAASNSAEPHPSGPIPAAEQSSSVPALFCHGAKHACFVVFLVTMTRW